MATSGKIQGKTYNSDGVDRSSAYGTWIEWKRNSYSVTNNTSNITVTVYVKRIDGFDGTTAYNLDDKPTVSLTVGGTAKSPTTYYIDTRGQVLCTVATWTGNVSHSANGSLSLSLSCNWELKDVPVLKKGNISGTAVLDTIPRASTISKVDGSLIGSEITVTISRADSSFKHQLWYKVGNSGWYDLGKGYDEICKFTIDLNTANQFPNATTGNMQLCVRTFSGSTQIGSDYYKDVTVGVPPYNIEGSIKLTGNNLLSGAYVQGKSTVTAEITASTMYGATIKSYSATVDGKTYTGNKFTSAVLSNGSKTVSVTVTDTRGRTLTLSSSSFTVYAYAVPSITEFTVVRQADETTVIATVKGSVAAVNNKNAKTITVTLNGVTQTITSSGYTINGTTTFTNVPTDNTLTATAKIKDSYTYDSKDTVLPTVKVTEDYHHSGNGKALGKVSETEDLLDVDWNELVRKDLTVDGKTTLNKALTVSDTDWKTVILKRFGAIGAVTIQFQNDTGSLGFIGMTGNELNTPLRRWTSDGATAYTVLDTALTKDFVVEQGTSGVWYYRKWNSGFAECHGYHTVSGLNISTAWGSWYSSSAIVLPSFPFTFSGSPDVHVSWESDFSAVIDGVGKRESTKAGQVYLYRPVAQTNINGRFSIYAYGKWK